MKDNLVYIRHIVDAIKKTETYLSKMTFEEFKKDDKTVDAVIRNIEIVGEATAKCSSGFKNKNPQIPWRKMTDTRNKLIHDYMGVSINIVWGICKEDLPSLLKDLESILK